jgi:hypothetical protein
MQTGAAGLRKDLPPAASKSRAFHEGQSAARQFRPGDGEVIDRRDLNSWLRERPPRQSSALDSRDHLGNGESAAGILDRVLDNSKFNDAGSQNVGSFERYWKVVGTFQLTATL